MADARFICDSTPTTIYHLSDTHIPTGDGDAALNSVRLRQFEVVIASVCDRVKSDTGGPSDKLFVLTGDVFDKKVKVDAVALSIFLTMFERLTEVAPVVVIRGNHDFAQDDPDRIDPLGVYLRPFQREVAGSHAVHYLRDSGVYRYGSVLFGVLDVGDVLDPRSGRGVRPDGLPPFPAPGTDPPNVTKIALFHGTVKGATAFSNYVPDDATSYPLSMFQGYDYALLGDVHRHQIGTARLEGSSGGGTGHGRRCLKYTYAGSLVCCNFGEPTTGHGFTRFDIASGDMQHVDVENPFAMVTICRDGGAWRARTGFRAFEMLDRVLEAPGWPTEPIVRLYGATASELQTVLASTAPGVRPSIVRSFSYARCRCDGGLDLERTGSDELGSGAAMDALPTEWGVHNTPAYWSSRLPDLSDRERASLFDPTLLLVPTCASHESETGPQTARATEERNHALRSAINAYEALDKGGSVAQPVSLLGMTVRNMACFGGEHAIDFGAMVGSVVLLNGANEAGKSSVITCLLYTLFGEFPDGVKSLIPPPTNEARAGGTAGRGPANVNRASIVHRGLDDKPAGCAHGEVRFRRGRDVFRLRRAWDANGAQRTQKSCTFLESEPDAAGAEKRRTTGVKEIAKFVRSTFGSIEDMQMGNVACQADAVSLFSRSRDAQEKLLERAFSMAPITEFGNLLVTSAKNHAHVCRAARADIADHVATANPRVTNDDDGDDDGVDRAESLRLAAIDAVHEARNECERLSMDTADRERARALTTRAFAGGSEHSASVEFGRLQRRVANATSQEAEIDAISISALREQYDGLRRDARAVEQQKPVPSARSASDVALLSRLANDERSAFERFDKEKDELARVTGAPASDYATRSREGSSSVDAVRRTEIDVQLASAERELAGRERSRPATLRDMTDDESRTAAKLAGDIERSRASLEHCVRSVGSEGSAAANTAAANTSRYWTEEDAARIEALRRHLERARNDVLLEGERRGGDRRGSEPRPAEEFNPACESCQKRRVELDRLQSERVRCCAETLQCAVDTAQQALDTAIRDADEAVELDLKERADRRRVEVAALEATLESAVSADRKRAHDLRESRTADLEGRRREHDAKTAELGVEVERLREHRRDAIARFSEHCERAKSATVLDTESAVERARAQAMTCTTELQNETRRVDERVEAETQAATLSWRRTLADMHATAEKVDDRIRRADELIRAKFELESATVVARYRDLVSAESEYNERLAGRLEAEQVKNAAVSARAASECHDRKRARLESTLAAVEASYARVDAVRTAFMGGGGARSGVREELYEFHILPIFCRFANEFLDGIHPMRLEHRRGDLVVGKRGRGDEPFKASGYQQFCLSLAIRCALHRLRMPGFSMSQLFIDEGFGACDGSNISRTRDMLNALVEVGGYDTVVLCSHLDSVREAADKVITVVMGDDGSSRIHQRQTGRRSRT